MGFFSFLFGNKNKTNFKELVQNGAIIIDVRSKSEYDSGHIKGSKHIPVDNIKNHVSDIKKWNKPIITCCRSGARSGMAKTILSQQGIECYNGGPWNSLESKIA